MTPRSLYLIITVLFLSINLNLALADNTLPIFVEPYPNSPSTAFDYTFNLTNQSDCSEVILNHTETITTNDYGRGFATIDLTGITAYNIPQHTCEFRNGVLRQIHNFSSSIFDNVYAQSVLAYSITGNLSGSYGYSYNDLTDQPTIPGDTNCTAEGSCSLITYDSQTSAWDKDSSDDFSGNYNDLTNKPDIMWQNNSDNAVITKGWVGIGTDSPNYALHIDNPSSYNYVQITGSSSDPSSNGGMFFGVTGRTSEIYSEDDIRLYTGFNGSQWNYSLRLKNSGDAVFFYDVHIDQDLTMNGGDIITDQFDLWDQNSSDDFTADQSLNTTSSVTFDELNISGSVFYFYSSPSGNWYHYKGYGGECYNASNGIEIDTANRSLIWCSE